MSLEEKIDMEIFDDAGKFCEKYGLNSTTEPNARNPISIIYQIFYDSGIKNRSISFVEFVEGINQNLSAGEKSFQIRLPLKYPEREYLSPSTGRGMDALSKYLLSLNCTKQQYESVMRASNRGYLQKQYIETLSSLN